MIERLEGHFWGYQDVELFYQVWKPLVARGTIVVTHGIAEHSDCYNAFATEMAEDGWLVFAWDLRGHGRSEGKRGYVNRFQDFSDDLEAAIRFVKADVASKGKPLFLFGHSMGGQITLKTMLNHAPQGIAALLLSSPALGLSIQIPKLKERAAHLLAEWMPKFTLFNEINYEMLTRDRDVIKSYKTDPLRHDKISPRLFLGMQESFEEIQNGAASIHLPILMQLAGKEKVVSSEASEKIFELFGSKKKEIYIYTDSYHEIFNDLDRADVFRDLKTFLAKTSAGN